MAVVDNVIRFKPKSMTTVSIEESDESWALKLLSENDLDEQHVTVEGNNFHNVIQHQNSEKPVQKEPQTILSSDEIEDFNIDDLAQFDASMLSLSAIEVQKLAIAEKEADLLKVQKPTKLSTSVIFERFKAFLNYDLLTFMK